MSSLVLTKPDAIEHKLLGCMFSRAAEPDIEDEDFEDDNWEDERFSVCYPEDFDPMFQGEFD